MEKLKGVFQTIGGILTMFALAGCAAASTRLAPTAPPPTDTALPSLQAAAAAPASTLKPLPDFPQFLFFGGSGGGPGPDPMAGCVYPGRTPAVTINPGPEISQICIWGIKLGQPFQLQFTSPDGKSLSSANLWASRALDDHNIGDENPFSLQWEGFGYGGNAAHTQDGIGANIYVWFPFKTDGRWNLKAVGKGINASTLFTISSPGPDFYVSDPNSAAAIIPLDSHYFINAKSLKIHGHGFPANNSFYLVLYKSGQYLAAVETKTTSDGMLDADFSGALAITDGSYYIYAIANDPGVLASLPPYLNWDTSLLFDNFVIGQPDPVSACIGAPPQRVQMNKSGTVCTKSDQVFVRQDPAKSAAKLFALNTGSIFKVTGGPTCSDSWSWWQIKTRDGKTGWISEGGDQTDPYFICPKR